MKSLDEFYEGVKQHVRKGFDDRGEHLPTFLLETKNGILAIPAPWADYDEKIAIVGAVRQMCLKIDASRVVLIMEAWMVSRPKETVTAWLVPSKEPDREEVLWIVGQSRVDGERERTGFYKIARPDGGKARLAEFVPLDSNQGTSIFDGLVGRGVLQ